MSQVFFGQHDYRTRQTIRPLAQRLEALHKKNDDIEMITAQKNSLCSLGAQSSADLVKLAA